MQALSTTTQQQKPSQPHTKAAARVFGHALRLGLVAAALIFAAPLLCQQDSSTIRGSVTDPTGAVIPDVKVVVTDTKTNRQFVTKTDSKGEYYAPTLTVSVYKIEFSFKGFSTTVLDAITLDSNATISESAVLRPGGASDIVNIQADSVQINSDSGTISTTIPAEQVAKLPLNGRDFTDLLTLVPGAIQNTGSINNDSLGGFPSGQFGANMLVDGTDATRVDGNTTFSTFGRGDARLTRSSVDNIQEVHVLSSAYSAEYGRAVGEIVNVITKSGSNTLHGEAFEFFRNDILDAKNYFFNGTPAPLRLNQFGGNLGGAIVKDKLFYFVNYEGVRQIVTNPVTGNSLVLNARMRAMADPSMAPVIAKIPLGNGGPAPTQNHIIYGYWFDVLNGVTTNDITENTAAIKLDYILSPKSNFAVRYNYNASDTYGVYGLAIGQNADAPQLSQLGKATWNYIGSPTFFNEAGFAINSPHSHQSAGEPGLPIFSCYICNVGFGTAPSPQLFQSSEPSISYQALDTVTKIAGRNQMRMGVDIRWNNVGRSLDQQDTILYAGGPTVEAATDLPCDGAPQGTNGCVDPSGGPEGFLANDGVGWTRLGYPLTHMKNTQMAYFFNDDWKVHPRFTLNLGLRYEYNTVLHAAENNVQNFDIKTLSLLPASTPLYNADWTDFAPRVGFAWNVGGKGLTSLRGGFGLFFLPIAPGSPLNLAGNTEENLSINLDQQKYTCTPALTVIRYPLPAQAPTCTPQAPVSYTAFDRGQKDTYSEQWSLSLDQELAKNVVLTLAYRGNHGLHEFGGANLNLENPLNGQNYISNALGGINFAGQFAESAYNAFNASIRANTHGLSITANYNWAHEFDDFMGLFEAYQNPRDIKADYSPGDIDVRDAFSVGFVYSVPRTTKLPERLGAGWQLSAIVQGRTGPPVNFGYSENNAFVGSLRPDCNFGISPQATNYSLPNNQFNPAAFSAPAGAYGDCLRNYGRGPGFIQPDLGILKTTGISEHVSWEFRGELFNFVNHPNFSGPGTTTNGFGFGTSYSTVGNLVGIGTSRQVQFSSKIIF
jgi:hypothetical protein